MSTITSQFDASASFTPITGVGPYRAADYWALPEGERVELIEGELITSPAPRVRHQIVIGQLFTNFRAVENKGGGLVIFSPADAIFSDVTILQPDLLYVAAGRRHIVGDRIQGPPDLVIEVLSDGAERRDTVTKLDLYAKFGVPEYWIVDPRAQTIEFLVLEGERYAVHTGVDNRYQSPRLPEVEIDLAAFWREVDERLPRA